MISQFQNFTVNLFTKYKAKNKKRENAVSNEGMFIDTCYHQDGAKYNDLIVANMFVFLVRYGFMAVNFDMPSPQVTHNAAKVK